jgi:hypothetical protein
LTEKRRLAATQGHRSPRLGPGNRLAGSFRYLPALLT